MTPSICSSLYLPHTRSFLASCTRTTTATPAIGANSLVRRKIQSPSSLASKSPSITEKSLDGFNSMSLSIPTMETMEEVGALIAILSQPTDVLFLDGDLGAGKTTFSRGFIKCKLGAIDDDCDDEEIDHSEHINSARVKQASLRITSPTYLLSNTYEYREDDDHSDEERTREIHHMDLYRLSGKSSRDFDPLGLSHVFSNCISLIEWPSRLQAFPELLPSEETLLQIDLRIPDPTSDERVMSLVSSSESSWNTRLQYLVDEGMIDDLLLSLDDDDDENTGCENDDVTDKTS